MIGNALLVVLSFLAGWVALWPARRALGAWQYPLAALPVGLLGWTMAAGAAGLLGRRMSWPLAMRDADRIRGFVFWRSSDGWVPARRTVLCLPCGRTSSLGGRAGSDRGDVFSKMTVISYDSWAHYQLAGIYLADHGRPDPVALGATGLSSPRSSRPRVRSARTGCTRSTRWPRTCCCSSDSRPISSPRRE